MNILVVGFRTKGGRENVFRTGKYGNIRKVCMREGNCMQSQARLIRTVYSVIRIRVVPVAAFDVSANKK